MTNRELLQKYKQENYCLDIHSLKVGKLNINWVLQNNPRYSPTENDKYTRYESRRRELNQLTITKY
jgi:hypothetical protein